CGCGAGRAQSRRGRRTWVVDRCDAPGDRTCRDRFAPPQAGGRAMTISASWRHRLRVLEFSAAKNVRRRPRDLAGLSLAELIDEYQNAVREFNAATAEIPVERVQAELDRLARAFGESIGAQVEEAETTPEAARNVNIRSS